MRVHPTLTMAATSLKSKDSASWEDILAEMNDKSQMEDLRQHLKNYGLFPRDVDPDTAPIKLEYLQKLARQWKLHHKRGFWKEHSTQSALVVGLHQHHTTLLSTSRAKTSRPGKEESKDGGRETVSPDRDVSRTNASNLPTYGIGDKFGTRGDYVDGTMYLSRFTARNIGGDEAKRNSNGALEAESKLHSSTASIIRDASLADDDEGEEGEVEVPTNK